MEFANKLTKEQITQFIETILCTNVKKIKLIVTDNTAYCRLFITGCKEIMFTYTDFYFNIPSKISNLNVNQTDINIFWQKLLFKNFGKEYALCLSKYVDKDVEVIKAIYKNKIHLAKSEFEQTQAKIKSQIALLEKLLSEKEVKSNETIKNLEKELSEELNKILSSQAYMMQQTSSEK